LQELKNYLQYDPNLSEIRTYTQYLILWPTNPDQYDKEGTVPCKTKNVSPLKHSVEASPLQEKQITQVPI